MSLLTVFGFVHKARAVFLYCFNIYMGKVIILKKTQIIVVNSRFCRHLGKQVWRGRHKTNETILAQYLGVE